MKSDFLHNSTNISVLERQRAHLLDPLILLHQSYFPSNFTGLGTAEPYHSLTSGWPDFLMATVEGDQSLSISPEKITPSTSGSGSFKKRKFDSGFTETEDDKKKKKKMMKKECEKQEDESKTTEQNIGSDKSLKTKTKHKDNKTGDFQKTDYIHVRARRGQATDSHSLAERVRREKISERMKYLQDLVPGCTKITGKAGMLDEIINYVQSLQRQVEFLSMKLAAVNPRLDFNVDDIFTKQVDAVSIPMNNFQNGGISSQQMFNSLSDPISCFNIGQAQANSMWVSDLQNIYSNIGV